MLSIILTAAAIILLLVLLVPVGFAFYQRIKPEPPAKPAPPPRAAPPPPSRAAAPAPREPERKPLPDMKPPVENFMTAPVPVLNETPAPPPKKPAVDLEATRTPKKEEAPKQGEPGGTEMLEWYGMLRCTGGPLEGQHFIVENDGLYIGRDASMANVVVNDSRVSKRHLRIVPRNGRVWAIDEGSTNGTFLSSAPAERITEHQLKRGDTLVLADGAATFVYQI